MTQQVFVIVGSARIERALPAGSLLLRHRPPKGAPAAWTRTALARAELADVAAVDGALRIARARIQGGLDLWTPSKPRLAVAQYELISCRPDAKADYERSQVEVTAPAMRRQWEAGRVQRFVGVDIVEDLITPEPAVGTWDVLHLTAVAVRSFFRMLRWRALFDDSARQAGYADMAALSRIWDEQRTLITGSARIRGT